MTSKVSVKTYPQYCFDLAPTLKAYCPLRATDIQDLQVHPGFEGQDLYFYDKLPIKWVRLVGLVVAIDDFYGRRIYTIDDSSGVCIECVLTCSIAAQKKDEKGAQKGTFSQAQGKQDHQKEATEQAGEQSEAAGQLPASPQYPEIDVGAVLDIKGTISVFRNEKQIKILKAKPVLSTEQEVALWERRSQFRRDVLTKPWVLSEKQILKCRRKAEETDEDAERRRKRRRGDASAIETASAKAAEEKQRLAEKENRPRRDRKVKEPKERPEKMKDPAVDPAVAKLVAQRLLTGGFGGKYSALGL